MRRAPPVLVPALVVAGVCLLVVIGVLALMLALEPLP
jgi:hypothetical protein